MSDTSATAPALPDPARPTMRDELARIPIGLRIKAVIGAVALSAVAVASLYWSQQPDWRVLYGNLSDKDGGAIIASLEQLGVPYRFTDGGGAIQVPAQKLHDARLKLASQGLPRGGTVGYELLENQKFGTTQFQERLNFQRGLEGELTRSIQSLAAVESARVHLALPPQNGFLREQQKPSASVVLALRAGRSLDRQQVAGIVHLVASSVPELDTRQVSVIDQNGTLLSSVDANGAMGAGLDPMQTGQLRTLEASLNRKILDLLEPILGAGNVRTQVSADVDFTQTESTAEIYRPNQGSEPAAVRSQQSIEATERAPGTAAQGIPGALTNQPPAEAQAPINGVAQATRAAKGAAPGGAEGSARKESMTNYEVDKTIRVTRAPSGAIKRLSIAVLVNQRQSLGADGKPVSSPLSEKEIADIGSLVREAVGFSKDRGDSINVVNAPFSRPEGAAPVADLPFWQQPQYLALAADWGRQAGFVLLALMIFMMFIRPALKSASKPATPPPALKASIDDPLELPEPAVDENRAIRADDDGVDDAQAAAAVPAIGQSQQEILTLARQNPAAVANVVREWVGGQKGA
ncbi:MAG: flagellar basal-body MS-ring/collar protein FliF [Lautropia sp.]